MFYLSILITIMPFYIPGTPHHFSFGLPSFHALSSAMFSLLYILLSFDILLCIDRCFVQNFIWAPIHQVALVSCGSMICCMQQNSEIRVRHNGVFNGKTDGECCFAADQGNRLLLDGRYVLNANVQYRIIQQSLKYHFKSVISLKQ